MIFSPSFNAISITTLVDHPRTYYHPRIRSLGHRPNPYSLNSTPEITGPHTYDHSISFLYELPNEALN